MAEEGILDIQAVDPRCAEAADLIRALSGELARLYEFGGDGSGNFKPAW